MSISVIRVLFLAAKSLRMINTISMAYVAFGLREVFYA
jgi:hypothetical protein